MRDFKTLKTAYATIKGFEVMRALVETPSLWYRVRKPAGIEDARLHDLRHSFASRALAIGQSLPMIGKLLGHRKVQTTARYAHLARDSVKAAAERVSDSIAADLDNPLDVSAAA